MDWFSFLIGLAVGAVILYIRNQYYLAEVLKYPTKVLNEFEGEPDAYANEIVYFLRARMRGAEYAVDNDDNWDDLKRAIEEHGYLKDVPKDMQSALLSIHNAQYATGSTWLPVFLRMLYACGLTMEIRQASMYSEAPSHVPNGTLRRVINRNN